MDKVLKNITNHLFQPFLQIRHFQNAQWIIHESDMTQYICLIQKSFPYIKSIHQQFLCDFPRQRILIHGLFISSIQQFLSILENHVDPQFHILVVMMCTQASLASTFEWVQSQLNGENTCVIDHHHSSKTPYKKSIALDTFASNNNQMKIHMTIKTPQHIQFIIEKRFVQMNIEPFQILKTIDTITCFELNSSIQQQKQVMMCACVF